MKILAFDGTAKAASVALLEDGKILASYTVDNGLTQSELLLPMAESVLKSLKLEFSDVDVFATSVGPGSFTGVRIGVSLIKGLAFGRKAPCVAVSTLEALAENLVPLSGILVPCMDARRNQVYTGIYEFVRCAVDGKEGTYSLETIEEQCAVDIHDIAVKLNALGREVCLLGDGVPVFKEILAELLTVPHSFAPAHMNRQSAASLAALAQVYYKQGRIESAAEHQPIYLRLSQAERERMESGNSTEGQG